MPLMRRRPLLRAAAVGGGAYMAGRHRANAQAQEAGQEERIEGLEQQAAPPAPAAPAPVGGLSSAAVERLKELGALHEQGVLTDEEFNQQKTRLLAG
jgi:hypothetical protein